MSKPILNIDNLTKRFGGVTAVNGINLEVMPKETIAIIGPNGAGKTTFYNMVSGRMLPTEGKITLDGQDITGLPPHKISRLGVSRSFQINNIFPEMTVQENVEVVLSAYHGHSRKLFNIASRNTGIRKEAVELLARLGIDATVSEVGCQGLCYAEPLVDVQFPGDPRVFYQQVSPETLPPLAYGPDDLVRKVHDHGLVQFHGRKLKLSKAFNGQSVALRPTSQDGLWQVFSHAHHITTIDERDYPK